MSFDGKVAIVTGAGRGIGREVALAFLRERACVAALDVQEPLLRAWEAEATAHGPRLLVRKTDVTLVAEADAGIAEVVRRFGQVDILVNAAGILKAMPLLETTEADWDAIQAVNVKGMLFMTQAAARAMIPRRRGRIINFASIAAKVARRNLAAYCCSKAAVVQLTQCAALDLAPHGIRVTAIAPGPTDTEMIRGVYSAEEFPRTEQNLLRGNLEEFRTGIPIGRLLRPPDLAAAALFLASDATDGITGSVLWVDGGQSML